MATRMDVIGQNGNDGLHYDEIDAVKFVEEKYPETTKEFRRLQQEQYRVFCENISAVFPLSPFAPERSLEPTSAHTSPAASKKT